MQVAGGSSEGEEIKQGWGFGAEHGQGHNPGTRAEKINPATWVLSTPYGFSVGA